MNNKKINIINTHGMAHQKVNVQVYKMFFY
jgi:hypothetical protein